MPPKRKPLGELPHNTIHATSTTTGTTQNKRTRSSRAAACRASAAVSELVSATAGWNKENHHCHYDDNDYAPEFFPQAQAGMSLNPEPLASELPTNQLTRPQKSVGRKVVACTLQPQNGSLERETVAQISFEPLERGEPRMHAQHSAGYQLRVNEVSHCSIGVLLVAFNLTACRWLPVIGFLDFGPKQTGRFWLLTPTNMQRSNEHQTP